MSGGMTVGAQVSYERIIDDISQLPSTDLYNGRSIRVSGGDRQGIYVYDKSKASINNEYTIFNGFVLKGALVLDAIDVDKLDNDIGRTVFVKSSIDSGKMFISTEYGFEDITKNVSNYKTYMKSSSYVEEVNIPKYDTTNIEHVIVDYFNYETIFNDPTKRCFFIASGSYPNAVTLTQSGTDGKRKIVTLLSKPSDNPICKYSTELHASLNIILDNASYWVIDNISSINYNGDLDTSYSLINGSSNNILNELYLTQFTAGVNIDAGGCNYNTIQNCFFDKMNTNAIFNDKTAIALRAVSDIFTVGNKIINNDIKSCNDGVQLVRTDTTDSSYIIGYDGTIIDSNRIWMDKEVFYDGSGNQDDNGDFIIGENAIDLKAGSEDTNNPIVVTNNVMYNYKRRDENTSGSFSVGQGVAVVSHFGVYNVVFENNIIYDSQIALSGSSISAQLEYAQANWSIKNNIFHNINTINPLNEETYGMFMYDSDNITWENNVYSNIPTNTDGNGRVIIFSNNTNCLFKNNVFINAYTYGTNDSDGGVTIDTNYYFGGSAISSTYDTNRIVFSNARQSMSKSLSVLTSVFEKDINKTVVSRCFPSRISPHYQVFSSFINSFSEV